MRQQIIVAVGTVLLAGVFLAVWVLSLPDTPAALLTASAPTPLPALTAGAGAGSTAVAPAPPPTAARATTAPPPPTVATPPIVAALPPTEAPTPLPPDAAPPPTPVATPTAIPTPTALPQPTVLPTPTAIPTPVPTPQPTPTPTARPTPMALRPTPTPLPEMFIAVDCPGYRATVRRTGEATVVGRTLPNSQVEISNSIRGRPAPVERAGLSDASGRFAVDIELDDSITGLNSLDVRANHLATGEVARAAWLVYYKPAAADFAVRIDEPRDCADIPAYQVRVAGQTAPGAKVTVNDRFATAANTAGEWSVEIGLPEKGSHTITAVATRDGSAIDAADSITVIHNPE